MANKISISLIAIVAAGMTPQFSAHAGVLDSTRDRQDRFREQLERREHELRENKSRQDRERPTERDDVQQRPDLCEINPRLPQCIMRSR